MNWRRVLPLILLALPLGGCGPTVTSVIFPAVIIGDGTNNIGTVNFSAPMGNIVRADFNPVNVTGGTFTPFSFNPNVFGQTQGSFQFVIFCNASSGQLVATIAVTLTDDQGNTGAPFNFTFTCVPPSAAATSGPSDAPGDAVGGGRAGRDGPTDLAPGVTSAPWYTRVPQWANQAQQLFNLFRPEDSGTSVTLDSREQPAPSRR